jgi:uncharacterized protein YukE
MADFSVHIPKTTNAAEAFRNGVNGLNKIMTDLDSYLQPMMQHWDGTSKEQWILLKGSFNAKFTVALTDLNLNSNKLDDITDNYVHTDKKVSNSMR